MRVPLSAVLVMVVLVVGAVVLVKHFTTPAPEPAYAVQHWGGKKMGEHKWGE